MTQYEESSEAFFAMYWTVFMQDLNGRKKIKVRWLEIKIATKDIQRLVMENGTTF
jgi:hypothetical protein